jgi:hypothetical protein
MLVCVGTIEELRTALDSLWPGSRAGLSQAAYAVLFPMGELDDDRVLASQFARTVRCSMNRDREADAVWFEKWLPPDAA